MKTTRLIHVLWVAALAIGFAGCASDNEPTSAAGKDADSQKELTFTAGTPDDGSTQTRVAYEDTERKLTWQADDKLLMAGFDGGGSYKGKEKYTYEGTPGATSGDFTGNVVTDATTYTAYYPHTVELDADGANPTLSMDGQKQSADGNTDHLKDYMLLQATGVTPDVPFSLTMKSSIMKFDLKNIPEDVGNLRSLIWAVKSSGNGEKYLVLNFPEGVVSFGSGTSTLTAYLGFMPQEMSMGSKGKFTVTLMGDKTYRRQIDVSSGMNYEEGKRYTAEIDGSWESMAYMTFTTSVTAGQEYFPFAYTTVGAPADMVIDWGKNEKPLFVSSGAAVSSHKYLSPGDYTITIYSAQTNATEQQIPTLAFKETDLLSVATPLLNTGTSSLGSLFYGCTKLASLPQGLFDNHPNVWSFQSTFNGCRVLTSLPDGLFNKNKEVTTFNACFQGCYKLESLPIGLFDQNTKVKSFTSCFTGCSSLTELPEGLFAKNMEAYDFSDCFMGCSTLTLNKLIFSSNQEDTERFKDVAKAMNFKNCFFNVGKNIANAGEAPRLWLYDTGGKTWTTTNCFTSATKLSNYSEIPTDWGGEK